MEKSHIPAIAGGRNSYSEEAHNMQRHRQVCPEN